MSADQKIIKAQSDLVWSKGVRQVFRMSLASGRSLRATGNHRVFTGDGWKTVAEIGPGSRVAVARQFPSVTTPVVWSDAEIALLGHLVGDGSYLKNRPLRYTTSSEANSRVGHRMRLGARQYGDAACGPRQLAPASHCEQWQPLARRRRRCMVERPRNTQSTFTPKAFAARRVPIQRCANRTAAQAFVGYGWLYSRPPAGQRGAPSVYFCSCSEQLVRDVAALLLRLGIVGRMNQVRQDSGRPLWSVYVSGSEQQALFLATSRSVWTSRSSSQGFGRETCSDALESECGYFASAIVCATSSVDERAGIDPAPNGRNARHNLLEH